MPFLFLCCCERFSFSHFHFTLSHSVIFSRLSFRACGLVFCIRCKRMRSWLLSCFHYKKMNYDVDRHNFHWLFRFRSVIREWNALENVYYTKGCIDQWRKKRRERQRKIGNVRHAVARFFFFSTLRECSVILNDRIWITLHMNWIDANMVQCFIIIISVQRVYHFKCTGLHASQVKTKPNHERCSWCALCYIRYAYSSILTQRAKDFFILTFNGALQHHSLHRVR